MSKQILILDDHQDLLEILRDLFHFEGYKVKICDFTKDIFSLINDHKPDLIILDYLMNGLNGGEICAQIKKNQSTSHIPIIILSAYDKVIMSLGDYGSDLFIAKPFDNDDLLRKVKGLLNLKSSVN